MRRGLLVMVICLGMLVLAPGASAHQVVELNSGDSSAEAGPLLPDGTVSYAVRATVVRGEERGFRFRLAAGSRMAVQLLIFDEDPANLLAVSLLPEVIVLDPKGRGMRLAIDERTPFYEPYSRKAYLYLSRVDRAAVAGTYRVLIRGRSAKPVEITVAVGYREVPGRVIR